MSEETSALKAEQFVYGRVSRGLAGSPGYQAAAATRGLAGKKDLIGVLERLSHYPDLPPGATPLPRYFFAKADDEWLTFGRTSFARDLSGCVGYFAHHVLLHRTDVLRCLAVPLRILSLFPFFESEKDLPDERILPLVDLASCMARPAEAGKPGFGMLGVNVLDRLIAPRDKGVHLVLTGTMPLDGIVDVFDDAFALVPPSLALDTAFCINFAFALDNLRVFSVVTSPERRFVTIPNSRFDEIPAADPDAATPYGVYLVKHNDRAAISALLPMLDGRAVADTATVIAALAAPMAAGLPAILEQTWPGWSRGHLAAVPELACAYYLRTPRWRDALKGWFDADPVRWLEAGLAQAGVEPAFRGEVVCWAVAQLVRQPAKGQPLIASLAGAKLLPDVLRAAAGLPLEQQGTVANLLVGAPGYGGELHSSILHRVLRLQSISAMLNWADWFARQPDANPSLQVFFAAVRQLERGIVPATLPDWERLDAVCYETVAGLAYRLLEQQRRPLDETALATLIVPGRAGADRLIAFGLEADPDLTLRALYQLEALKGGQLDNVVRTITESQLKQAAIILLDWFARREQGEQPRLNEAQYERLYALAGSFFGRMFRALGGWDKTQDDR